MTASGDSADRADRASIDRILTPDFKSMTDHFRYDLLTQQALRGVVRTVLAEAAKRKGLPGDHHFYISFDTTAEGVRMSERLRVQYPEQMTIILQHQFWDLAVTRARLRGRPIVRRHSGEARHSVRGGHRLLRSVGAVRPAVRGGGRGRGPPVAGQRATVQDKPVKKKRATPPVPAAVAPAVAATPAPAETDNPAKPVSGAEVVSIDRFRKKK